MKPNRGIEPAAAKQGAVAGFVHQAKNAYGKQDDGRQWDQREPGGYAGTADGTSPEECERHQYRADLRQSFDVIGLGVAANHGAPLAPEVVMRLQDRPPSVSKS